MVVAISLFNPLTWPKIIILGIPQALNFKYSALNATSKLALSLKPVALCWLAASLRQYPTQPYFVGALLI